MNQNIIPKILLMFILFLFILTNVYSQSANSSKDHVRGNFLDMETARVPTPYGFLVNYNYPISYMGIDKVKRENKLLFQVDAYYECWQLGFQSNELGDFILFQPRTYGRDCFTSFYFALGNTKKIDIFSTDNLGGPIYLIGQRYLSGYNKKTNFSFIANIYGGVFTPSGHTYPVCGIELGGGTRIPISTMALFLHLQLGIKIVLPDNTVQSSNNGLDNYTFDGVIYPTFNLGISYSFNFNN